MRSLLLSIRVNVRAVAASVRGVCGVILTVIIQRSTVHLYKEAQSKQLHMHHKQRQQVHAHTPVHTPERKATTNEYAHRKSCL